MKHCPHFNRCGGCNSLAISYPEQLRQKHELLQKQFHSFTREIPPVIGCVEPWLYRHKVQLPFGFAGKGKNGHPLIGCYANDSHRVVDQKLCLIQDGSCSRVAWALRDWARQNRLSVYNEKTGTGLLRHALIRKAAGTGELLVGLITNGPVTKGRRKLVGSLLKILENTDIGTDTIVGIVQNVNTRKTNVVLGNEDVVWWGRPYIKELLGTLKYKIALSTFFQVNPLQASRLYNEVLRHIPAGARVIDCYCGVGSIALWLSSAASEVFGIEENRASVKAARVAARANGISNAVFAAGDAQREMVLASRDKGFSTVVLDPPRKGLADGMTDTIIESALKKVIYVSCNPQTLQRDIALLNKDFACLSVQGVDMFPHTEHIECVAVLERR